jgi:hypothetical protein
MQRPRRRREGQPRGASLRTRPFGTGGNHCSSLSTEPRTLKSRRSCPRGSPTLWSTRPPARSKCCCSSSANGPNAETMTVPTLFPDGALKFWLGDIGNAQSGPFLTSGKTGIFCRFGPGNSNRAVTIFGRPSRGLFLWRNLFNQFSATPYRAGSRRGVSATHGVEAWLRTVRVG